jgi:hypothetical protein
MATYKSEFSLGTAGRLKEVAGFQYNDAGSGALSASVLLRLGAGFDLAGTTLSAVALGTGGYAADNGSLATQGYVDQAVAGVVPGIPGDATYIDFPVASGATFTAGSVVALNGVREDEATSNVVGVFLSKPTAILARVQVDGQVAVSTDLSAFAKGDLVWASPTAGAVGTYAALASGDYATQVGIVSDTSAAPNSKIILQQRIFGLVG